MRGIQALPKVAKERMEDGAHEQPVMKEAAAGLISFLSAHRNLLDRPRLMGWKELTRCLFAAQRRQAKPGLLWFDLRVQQTSSPRLKFFEIFAAVRHGEEMGDVIIRKSMCRNSIDPAFTPTVDKCYLCDHEEKHSNSAIDFLQVSRSH